ncbi:Macrophage mannose receptor 1 [Armadillidium nasatum]|uniref:Macrophage mannose receptor 1 n=1 Tax=Armadillidium nasatum TaxID=96803 RepID=A0A5N5T073_9CRUS|nr:Macrophage mannose receptor 1 [Armadillidium nasatum]
MKKRPISWPESQQICEQKNAFLASIHSKEENQWILSKINSFEDNFLWIGGKYDGNSKFLWDDGTSFDYIHWAKGEPNNLNGVTSKSSENKNSKIIFPSEMMTPKGHEKLAGGCPENWYRMDNKCVKFYDMVLMTYYEAKDFCSSLDGKATLVSIHSEKQLDDDFIWEDKTEVDYVHWAEFEPTMSSSVMQDLWSVEQGCVQVIVNGEEIGFWKDTDCYRQARAFVCQRPLDSKYERTLLPFPKKCSAPHDDYYSFGDYCYKFISTPLNWQNAENTCAEEGGHLVTIRNRKEMSYLWNQFFPLSNSSDIWIGLRSSFVLIGETRWNSGWPLVYTNWSPVKLYYRICASMISYLGKWINQYCYYERPFVCEYSKQTLTDTDSANSKHCPKLGRWIDFPGDYCYSFDSSKSLSCYFGFDECVEMVSLGGFWKVDNCSKKKLFICKTSKIVSGVIVNEFLKEEKELKIDPQNDELVAMDNSAVVDLKDPLDETSERGIGGVAIGGILVLILFVIGSGFLAGYFLMKKRQVQNAQPTTFYGFDNVIYNADTITVAGQQIVCAPEERECILDDHEEVEVEDPKFSLTKS